LLNEIGSLSKELADLQIKEGKDKRAIMSLRTQMENQSDLTRKIEDLKRQLSKNEADLMKQKQRVFDAVKSVPQTINIVGNPTKK